MVKIPNKNYLIGMTEVTQAQWQEIMGNNPSKFKGDLSCPVESVSWNDCQEFIKKLNSRLEVKSAGITFRLPTSEEWEYACRAGSTGKYGLLADGREGTLVEMGWYGDVRDKTLPVGQKTANAWGLYDMHGNVWEWTASTDGEDRISCGGSYYNLAFGCGADIIYCNNLDFRNYRLGFRLVASRTEK
jgi:formylglycine-generating enzyme required for sulfatase activity